MVALNITRKTLTCRCTINEELNILNTEHYTELKKSVQNT